MAENDTGQERTEQPTPKRLQDARRKGQIARSRELNTMAITLVGGLTMMMMSGHFGQGMSELMRKGFSIARADAFDSHAMLNRLVEAVADALLMLLPLFAIIVVVAILSSVALGGITISTEAMSPKLSKLDPIKGMKRVFSLKGLMELAKSMAKFVLIGGATTLVLWLSLDRFIALSGMHLQQGIAALGNLVGWSLVLISTTLILIALVDVPF
ncbi:MAG: hypothetical protein B0D96_11340 [Candidatus Sedimenticola endophacoides]|uniref:Flagellar biosynthetic protein FlhB n=1 Tax=Candidatus Sedimenticola endophacoides TaxID=2548426 RepID=A0A6N4DHQ0_9GAMM|nr:MAG: hypothetical protein B0D94_06700 [Candidatus Sedimenticola endophacoides]OQX33612.1 MAG: hypothetical protein B0D96_11340 [Candidatus Sedimenticola endophacoides]OQX38774.1 MAG: hypothetical protein B0D89_12160 [Candidatus Sedimenticola endophacoides]PUD97910.1 MAG: hypothetical protein C3L24_13705 [Candidatus Sedimenticola endophacoides]PUE03696.1 MAG: hypothetical protein C3L26_00365 [Candidatus Sedimenticola endophacoides]